MIDFGVTGEEFTHPSAGVYIMAPCHQSIGPARIYPRANGTGLVWHPSDPLAFGAWLTGAAQNAKVAMYHRQ